MDTEAACAKLRLEKIYSTHHADRERYGYLFCGGARVPFLKRWIGQGKKILDIGCRDGMLTQHFAEGNFVTGIDIDQEALRQAKERLGIETHWLDINTEFPFESSQFDIVTACEVMEHIYDTRRFLENVFHCLKPGGLFLGSVPNSFRLRNRMRFLFGREYEDDPTHCHQFSPQRLREHLEELFEDVEIKHVGGSLFTFIHVSDTSPAYLNQLCAKDQLWKARKPC